MGDSEPTIFVVDDDAAVRDSLALLIGQEGLAVKSFASAEAFLSAGHPELRGCAVIDLRMPGMDGVRLQEEISRRGMTLPVIFLSGHGDIPTTVRCIKAGAIDFLTKPITRESLMSSIRSALEEGKLKRAQAETNQTAASKLASLTQRERDVMLLVAQGRSNKAVARLLNISHRTVEIHKARVMHKSGVANILDLAEVARAAGLLGKPPVD